MAAKKNKRLNDTSATVPKIRDVSRQVAKVPLELVGKGLGATTCTLPDGATIELSKNGASHRFDTTTREKKPIKYKTRGREHSTEKSDGK